jgi:transcriptional regulator with XRE-family HTH domain
MTRLQELVAGNLRRLRLDRRLTQEELAWRAGIDCRFIAFLEKGTYAATVTMLDRLAYALGVDPSDLFRAGDRGASPITAGERRALDIVIGRRLRAMRKARGLSREMMARRLGLSARRLQKHERGAKRVRPNLFERVAAILGVRISVFFVDRCSGEPARFCRFGRESER